MQCQSCGTQYPDHFTTCPNCGAPSGVPNQQAFRGNQPNPYPNQQQYPYPNQQQQGSPYQNQQQQGSPYQNQQQQGSPYQNQQQQGSPYQNQQQQYPYGNPYAAPNQIPRGMSKRDFYHSSLCKTARGNIIAASVIAYICAGITALSALIDMNIFILLDVALILGFSLGIHLGQSRVCAILLCIYASCNVLYTIIYTGQIGGWLILVSGIYSIVATFQFQSAWNKYSKYGQIPY